jgi:hypothetical protein
MEVLLAYDGSLEAKDILRAWVHKEQNSGNRLAVLPVFNKGLFVDYDAIPAAEEMATQEFFRGITEAREIILEAGAKICARIVEKEGVPKHQILRYAETRNVDMLLCPKRYKPILRKLKKHSNTREEEPIAAIIY